MEKLRDKRETKRLKRETPTRWMTDFCPLSLFFSHCPSILYLLFHFLSSLCLITPPISRTSSFLALLPFSFLLCVRLNALTTIFLPVPFLSCLSLFHCFYHFSEVFLSRFSFDLFLSLTKLRMMVIHDFLLIPRSVLTALFASIPSAFPLGARC